jgi:hypothetical protein
MQAMDTLIDSDKVLSLIVNVKNEIQNKNLLKSKWEG